ncbi:hypothetical protein [Streptomyces lydicus]|uniref:hypothetical protein n=1 Tax=Streptomyces lydicus TaxID=47763 RepID=UPI0010110BEB|nr:hypothetical protein [Streptomyces lydicus]MCZ1006357.1 hypothetical protein [Streptomyces lydicus]
MATNTIPSSPPAPPQRRLIAAGILTGRRATATEPITPSLRALVRDALGLTRLHIPRPELDETDTRICVWSVRELDDVHARTNGIVTARQVERTAGDGSPYAVIEVTVSVDVPHVGPVEAFTDWEPAAEVHGFALPLIRALTAGAAR